MQKPAAAPLVRAEWRIALDKENLRRLDSEVEAVLDKQVQNIHPKDNIPAIEKLLRTEDYCSMVEVRNAFAKSEKIKLGMMEKTFLNIKEAINSTCTAYVACTLLTPARSRVWASHGDSHN